MATRIKTKAQATIPQSKLDCQADIKKIGDLQREHIRLMADVNDQVANITKASAPHLDLLGEQIELLQTGVHVWCEANREMLCGKGKTANLVTGEVSWRQRPPSVRISSADTVIDTLKRLGLSRFVRVKEEPNKDAILAEPDAVRGVAGIAISTGVEDFIIAPFEVEVAKTAGATA